MNTRPLSPADLFRVSRAELLAHQEARLRDMLAAIAPGNRFYRRKFEAAGLDLATCFRSNADLPRLPFTTKEELVADQEENPPYGSTLSYPVERYVRLHQTSGTKGRPLRRLDSPGDWDWIMRCWEVIYYAAGVRPGDRFFFPFSFGPFLGFWAGFEAAVRLGHLTLPGGGMTSRARLDFLLANGATVVGCTPTYALHLAEIAERDGIDLAASDVRILIVAGEPGGNVPAVKARIEAAWGARCLDHSGMTEIGSLGFERFDNPGDLYLIESECVAEILDPATGEPVPPGRRGELVLTNLGRWGNPLIRYRTGDLVEAATEPCPAGSSLVRLRGGILARADDMISIRGNNVYPGALEAVIRRFPEIAEYRAEISTREGMGVLSLSVETGGEMGSNAGDLCRRVGDAVKDALNFRPEVALAAPGSLPRYELKASRFVVHPSFRQEGS